MISSKSFSREWIEFISQKYGYRDKTLIEKVIRAFSLLEALVDSGVPNYIFSGSYGGGSFGLSFSVDSE